MFSSYVTSFEVGTVRNELPQSQTFLSLPAQLQQKIFRISPTLCPAESWLGFAGFRLQTLARFSVQMFIIFVQLQQRAVLSALTLCLARIPSVFAERAKSAGATRAPLVSKFVGQRISVLIIAAVACGVSRWKRVR